MKRILIYSTVILSVIFVSCNGDKKIAASDVPPAAMSAFTAKYPAAANTVWITESKDGKTLYEAQFTLNNEKVEAEFDATGNFIKED